MPTALHATAPPAALPWWDLPGSFRAPECRVQWASGPWMNAQARALRRQVFCGEQALFDGDDEDAVDRDAPSARSLVALSCWGGQPDEVVGTVRIHQAEPGRWWGSRLAVQRGWRQHGRLGSTLIRLAVSSAHAQGCREFLAHVQAQNVALFQHLHWDVLGEVVLHGLMHALMRADLAHYPPCHTPFQGFVISVGRAETQARRHD